MTRTRQYPECGQLMNEEGGDWRTRNRRLTNKEPQKSEGRKIDEGGTEEGRALNRRLTNKEPQKSEGRKI